MSRAESRSPMTQRTGMQVMIDALVDAEIAGYETTSPGDAATLADFQRLRVRPREVTVNFSGGITQKCWTVTRSDGKYQVIYLPTAGYFSLCMSSDFGPLDMAVHGPALACFSSV